MRYVTSPPPSSCSITIPIRSIPSIRRCPGLRSACRSTLPANDTLTCRKLDHDITYNDVGNAILYNSGHYLRNLKLARLGVLPFFLLATAIVFLWARREYGDLAAVMAAALFTTLPNILAFSSIAYTDIVAASTQVALFFAFVQWLDKPTKRSALWFGLAAGLALASKATTLIFFPAAAVAILLGKWICTRTVVGENASPRLIVRHIAIVLALASLIVWATYGFAVQHVREGMNLSAESMPSFQHFPAPLARAARWLITTNPLMPAPAVVKGAANAWVLNKSRPTAYLLGRTKPGGWWYFFLVGVAVKAPLPLLVLAFLGVLSLRTFEPRRRWRALAPALAALAVLVITMPVSYNAGVRHVLVVFPLLAIVAGRGSADLWNMQGPRRWFRGLRCSPCCAGKLFQRCAPAATLSPTSTNSPEAIPAASWLQDATSTAVRTSFACHANCSTDTLTT